MKFLAIAFLLLVFSGASAQDAPAPNTTAIPQPKVDELVRLLQDPDVQAWLASRNPPAVQTETPAAQPDVPIDVTNWETATRQRINSVVSAIPRIPQTVAAASRRVHDDAVSRGRAPVMAVFALLVTIGAVGEWLFLRWRRSKNLISEAPPQRSIADLVPVGIFTIVIGILFFAVNWPPLGRIVLLSYLSAFVIYRCASVIIGWATHGNVALARRVRIIVGLVLFAIASATIGHTLQIDLAVRQAITYCISVIVLAVALETLWRVSARTSRAKIALTLFLIVIWLFWCMDLKGVFWLGIYALTLPGLLRATGHAAQSMIPIPLDQPRAILIVRGARAVVIGLAVAWLAVVWQLNPGSAFHQSPVATAIFYGALKSVVVILLADLIWHLTRAYIDRKLEMSADIASVAPAEAAKRGRLRTLLPILRNGLAAMVLLIAALIVLSQMGVEIGPLIAGAGVFGVAVGFGSQTLVKDVISGVFYMLDDAFRVGEYIQSKNYKGTVESFSLRSVRLRHHRGPVFTVPFGELGAVENMSRDWSIIKFIIGVSYDTDLPLAKKVVKVVGKELKEDPEFEPFIIETLKMKGVEQFGEYGIDLSFGMMLRPTGLQSMIRRKAYSMIRDAFRENGIHFAQPMVNVGGDEKSEAIAAATAAMRSAKLKEQTLADGPSEA